jgi:glycoside hydrolase-like protein
LFTAATTNTTYSQEYLREGKTQGDLLTADEANFLLNNNCRILLVHYGINPGGDYSAGVQDAMNAIAAVQNLSIPTGVTIYGDIETGVTPRP